MGSRAALYRINVLVLGVLGCTLPGVLRAAETPAKAVPATALLTGQREEMREGAEPDETTFHNLPVLSISLDLSEGISLDPEQRLELRGLIDIQPGFLVDQADIAVAVKRLYALGRFAQVTVLAQRQAQAVHLHFELTPLVRLSSLEVQGLGDLPETPFMRALRLLPGDEVDAQALTRLQGKALTSLRRQGYPDAQVTVTAQPSSEASLVDVYLTVHRGPPRRIGALLWTGDNRLPEALQEIWLPLQVGQVLSEDALEAARSELTRNYIAHGFLQVQVAPPRVQGTSTGGQAEVHWQVDAGPQVQLRVSGSSLLTAAALRGLWPESDGRLLLGTLDSLSRRIVEHLRRLGLPEAQVRHRQQLDPLRQLLQVDLQVDQGRAVRVTEIVFPGTVGLPEALMAAQIRTLLEREVDSETLAERLQPLEVETIGSGLHPSVPLPLLPPPDQRWVPDLYEDASNQLERAHRDLGYLQARVGLPRVQPEAGAAPGHLCGPPPAAAPASPCEVRVVVPIDAGSQVFVDSIDLRGNHLLDASEVLHTLREASSEDALRAPLSPGAPFSRSSVEAGRIALEALLRDRGLLFAQVQADSSLQDNGLWADIRYTFDEGPEVRVQRLLLRGNRFTRTSLLKRRLGLKPGDLFRRQQALADQRALDELGVFSHTQVRLLDAEHVSEVKDVVVEVNENARQSIEVSPGISTSEGPRLRAVYTHNNVLGSASVFSAALRLNRQIFFYSWNYDLYAEQMRQRFASYRGLQQLTRALERDIRVGLRSPRLIELPLDPLARIDLVQQQVNLVPYSLNSSNLQLGTDLTIGGGLRTSLDVQGGFTDLEPASEAQDLRARAQGLQVRLLRAGQRWTLKMGPHIVLDRRDNPLSPSRGFFARLRYGYAFGTFYPNRNDNRNEPFRFNKLEGELTGYLPLGPATLALSSRAGVIHALAGGGPAPLDERFFLGGRNGVRGFVEGSMVPQDACRAGLPRSGRCHEILAAPASGSLPLTQGGNAFVLLKSELRLPLRRNLTFDLFADLGNLWVDISHIPLADLALRLGTGCGLRYATPVGALALDVGFNPLPRRGYDAGPVQVHISIGAF